MVEDMSSSEKAPDVAATLKCDNTSGISCSKTMNNLVAVSKHTRIWCERKLDNNRLENLSRNRMQRIRAASLVEQAASGMQIVTLMICGKRQMEIPSKYRANIYAYLFIGMED
jgi:hypothetical protein